MPILHFYYTLSWEDQQQIKARFIRPICPKCKGTGIDEARALRDINGNLIPAYLEFGGFHYCQCHKCSGRGTVGILWKQS